MRKLLSILCRYIACTAMVCSTVIFSTAAFSQTAKPEPDYISYSNNIILLTGLTEIPDPVNLIQQETVKKFHNKQQISEIVINYDRRGMVQDAFMKTRLSLTNDRQMTISVNKDDKGRWNKQHFVDGKSIFTAHYHRDEQGRIIKVDMLGATPAQKATQAIKYDTLNKVIATTIDDGRSHGEMVYRYADNGKLAEMHTSVSANSISSRNNAFIYDEQDRLVKKVNTLTNQQDPTTFELVFSNFDRAGQWQTAAFIGNDSQESIREIVYRE